MKTQLKEEPINKLEVIDFGIQDARKRTIGAMLITWEADFIESEPPAFTWYTLEPGHYYALRVHATRNGKSYGATQSNQYFKTAAERSTAIDKYLASAQQRARARQPRNQYV